MQLESEIKDIKQSLMEISRKMDELIHEREITAMMRLSERSLASLTDEPDIYRIEDLKVRYR